MSTETRELNPLRTAAHSLLELNATPWMSLYMPIDRERNRIQLRNLLGKLRDEAPNVGMDQEDIDSLLAPAEDLLHESMKTEEELQGVALFLTPEAASPTFLPLPFAPSLVGQVDKRPWLRPLWRGVEPAGQFYVLSLWGGGAKLHRASQYQIDVVPSVGSESSLEAVLRADVHIESKLNWETPADSEDLPKQTPAIYRSQDDIRQKEYVEAGLLRFFRRVDGRLRTVLGEEPQPTPLVLAGPEQLRLLYQKASKYHHLMDDGVEDPIRIQGLSHLHQRAWEIVQPQFDEPRTTAVDQFHASTDLKEVNPSSVFWAAMNGRIDTLFVAENPTIWGTFEKATQSVQIHESRQTGDTELLNASTARTLQTGGTVYVTDPAEIPGGGPVAALLRY